MYEKIVCRGYARPPTQKFLPPRPTPPPMILLRDRYNRPGIGDVDFGGMDFGGMDFGGVGRVYPL